jgi:quercetin dioxygenase-like cupin family protein
MGLIAALPDIDKHEKSVFVMHEKSEKLIPFHKHTKGQLSYVEGGIAYITIDNRTYVVPARHFFWIPQGMEHILEMDILQLFFVLFIFMPMMIFQIRFTADWEFIRHQNF